MKYDEAKEDVEILTAQSRDWTLRRRAHASAVGEQARCIAGSPAGLSWAFAAGTWVAAGSTRKKESAPTRTTGLFGTALFLWRTMSTVRTLSGVSAPGSATLPSD